MRQHKIFQNKPKAFLLEEGGAALAVTEGAAREQVCIRVTLIRQGKSAAPSVFACGESSSLKDGAFLALPLGELSFARQMTERAESYKFVSGKSERVCSWHKPSLSLRDISPIGRDEFGLCAQVSKTQKLPREPCSQGSFVRYLGKVDYSS